MLSEFRPSAGSKSAEKFSLEEPKNAENRSKFLKSTVKKNSQT